jgi:hypothetical protein
MHTDSIKFNHIANIIRPIDPIGLISEGAPLDEYDTEINAIMALILNDKDVKSIEEKVYKVFCEAFDKEIAGEKSIYLKIAQEIMKIK